MKLIRAWIAVCVRCREGTNCYHLESNITQDRAAQVLRTKGWSDTKDGLLCPACVQATRGPQPRPTPSRVLEVIRALKSVGSGTD